MSYPAGVVRDLYGALDDALKSDEVSGAIQQIYPHLHEEGDNPYYGMRKPLFVIHQYLHDLYQEMMDAKSKFDLELRP
jgi:hypothetical protein